MKSTCVLMLITCLVFGYVSDAMAQRESISINKDWKFRFSHQVEKNKWERVDLPHTWNAQDALSGKLDYKRGIGNYVKRLFFPEEWKGKRIFLRFEGVNSVATVFLNGKCIGEHRGGYGAFVFELTTLIGYGKDNVIEVRANNAERLDVMPLVGDFNMYGGIYRDVELILTDDVCISPLDYASPGVYLIQKKVNNQLAEVDACVKLSNVTDVPQTVTLKVHLYHENKMVNECLKEVVVEPKAMMQSETLSFSLEKPRLWNGKEDPFMYRTVVSLWREGRRIDCIEQPLGLRYYHIDANDGFFLNGKHLSLQGVCRHQERAEVGNALRSAHHEEDVRLMLEMGVNAVRLAHYPQASYMYDLLDKYGIVTWAEIPFVGPGGYEDKGFVDTPDFRVNGKEQLKELIRQHYNHPSICFWGLFNELKEAGDNPLSYIKELNELAHREDVTRPTTAASNQNGALNFVTDLMAWNKYDGWYGATPASLAHWLDKMHERYPNLKIGISEYGAGGSIYHQQDTLAQSIPVSWWHPENWQTEYHIRNWEIIRARPFVWGTFVWAMFDFGAAHRREGDRPGINDKGLVTHDRKVKKDAFFFYKANWNPEPMVYIAGKRNVERERFVADIMVFSNCQEVMLKINGILVESMKPDAVNVCVFKQVRLRKGENQVEVVGINGRQKWTDNCCWVVR